MEPAWLTRKNEQTKFFFWRVYSPAVKIYTRSGDGGETGLYGGARVSKDAVRVQAYGTVDEANAALGLALSACTDAALRETLLSLQSTLFVVGGDLATPLSCGVDRVPRVQAAQTAALELQIDVLEARLVPLACFILPGGTALAAHLHLARTITRRAERCVTTLLHEEPAETSPEPLRYLNRLADLLFVLARLANHLENVTDIPWTRETP